MTFYQDLELLQQFSLIGRPRKQIIVVHRLIQAVLKDQLAEAELNAYSNEVVTLSDEALPKNWDTQQLRELCRRFQNQVVEPVCQVGELQSPRTDKSFLRVGPFLLGDGKLTDAELLQRRSRHILVRALGEEHPDTLTSMDNLALTYLGQGKLHEAAELGKKAWEARKRTLGEEHPDTLTSSMSNLAKIYEGLGHSTAAALLLQQSVDASQKILREDHLLTSLAKHWLNVMQNDPANTEDAA